MPGANFPRSRSKILSILKEIDALFNRQVIGPPTPLARTESKRACVAASSSKDQPQATAVGLGFQLQATNLISTTDELLYVQSATSISRFAQNTAPIARPKAAHLLGLPTQ